MPPSHLGSLPYSHCAHEEDGDEQPAEECEDPDDGAEPEVLGKGRKRDESKSRHLRLLVGCLTRRAHTSHNTYDVEEKHKTAGFQIEYVSVVLSVTFCAAQWVPPITTTDAHKPGVRNHRHFLGTS